MPGYIRPKTLGVGLPASLRVHKHIGVPQRLYARCLKYTNALDQFRLARQIAAKAGNTSNLRSAKLFLGAGASGQSVCRLVFELKSEPRLVSGPAATQTASRRAVLAKGFA